MRKNLGLCNSHSKTNFMWSFGWFKKLICTHAFIPCLISWPVSSIRPQNIFQSLFYVFWRYISDSWSKTQQQLRWHFTAISAVKCGRHPRTLQLRWHSSVCKFAPYYSNGNNSHKTTGLIIKPLRFMSFYVTFGIMPFFLTECHFCLPLPASARIFPRFLAVVADFIT